MPDKALRWIYANALFAVYPSMKEGWGLPVSEALGCGLPVLTSDAPSLAEAAQGLMPVLPARDAEAWTRAIARLLADEAELAALRDKVRAYRVRSARDFAGDVLTRLGAVAAGG